MTASHLRLTAIALLTAISALALPVAASAQRFFDPGPADKFLRLEVHGLAGGSTILQNYAGSFDEITSYDQHMGFSGGAGAVATFGLRDWLGLATEFNFLASNSSATVMMAGQPATPYAAVTLKNRYYTINIPVYVKINFNLATRVRWNLIGGIYYSLGLAGHQTQNVYTSYVNSLGQLINIHETLKPDYYRSSGAFINSSLRADWGIIFGTGIEASSRVSVGFRALIGLRNMAYITDSGTTRPSVHNTALYATLGYLF